MRTAEIAREIRAIRIALPSVQRMDVPFSLLVSGPEFGVCSRFLVIRDRKQGALL